MFWQVGDGLTFPISLDGQQMMSISPQPPLPHV